MFVFKVFRRLLKRIGQKSIVALSCLCNVILNRNNIRWTINMICTNIQRTKKQKFDKIDGCDELKRLSLSVFFFTATVLSSQTYMLNPKL